MDVIVKADSTPSGLGIVQNGWRLHLYSGCCKAAISRTGSTGVRCTLCKKLYAIRYNQYTIDLDMKVVLPEVRNNWIETYLGYQPMTVKMSVDGYK